MKPHPEKPLTYSERRFHRLSAELLFGSALLIAASLIPSTARAAQRPISDFLSTQGTFCWPDGSGGCFLFVPPAPNYIGWFDQDVVYMAVFDYAGIDDAYAGGAFGTNISGMLHERPLPDGRAEVSVELRATNVLAWAVAVDDDAPPGTGVFGHRLSEVLAGAQPELGSCTLQLKFINTAPGAPLPDLVQLMFLPAPGQELKFVGFTGEARGGLRAAFGVAEGQSGMLHVRQTGLLHVANVASGNSRVALDAYPAEKIIIREVPQQSVSSITGTQANTEVAGSRSGAGPGMTMVDRLFE